MERAGTAVAREAMGAFPDARRFACVCGGGSNGGDGRVAARVLREAGCQADVLEASGSVSNLDGYDVVVDALFGTGFRGEPRPEAAALIERMNAARAEVVAVDVPSGVDASTGEVAGPAVGAALTVTFHAPKVGLVVDPGRSFAGRIVVVDIGLEHAPTACARASPEVIRWVGRRAGQDTKYSAGSVLVVGGQPGMTGAVVLAGMAALRADAGYVTLAVPAESLPVVEALALEPVKVPWRDDDAVEVITAAAERISAVAIGPGLGRTPERQALVRELLERIERPAVVDADALFGLEPVERGQPTVLTPHAGELTRLLGAEPGWVNAHRLEAARQASERFGAVVLLKGRDTIVAAAPGDGLARFDLPGTVICDHGPPSLATAGTGDVLTGVLAALLTQMDAQFAAVVAAMVHAQAARAAPHQAGLVASDLLAALPAVLDR
jgi:ADP-dependent NAD(P)H-hydrate dehydratase / NAD(P)H-hydrate epimerase